VKTARHQPRSGDGVLPLTVIAAIAVAGGVAWPPVAIANPPGYTGQAPAGVAVGLLKGEITWTRDCTWWLVAEIAAVAAAAGLLYAAWKWLTRRRTRVDRATRSMAKRRDVAHLTGRQAEKTARRLQPHLAGKPMTPGHIGPALVRRVGINGGTGEFVRASMEDVVLTFAGPRAGKTITQTITHVVEHPGPVIATSNKRDLLDHTRGPRRSRSMNGVWVFDPQQISLEEQTWWFDPLDGCADPQRAARVAGIFAFAERPEGARTDAHFDNSARQLISLLLQAAAVGGKTILDAYLWSLDSESPYPEPLRILTSGGSGPNSPEQVAAAALAGKYGEPDRMRGSTFGTATAMLTFLATPAYHRWVTPQPGLRKFSPARFLASPADTLVLLSEGGPGSPAPLLGVLTDMLTEAGKARARAMGGRMDPPVLTVMDEAANLVRDPDLPRKVSYYGSYGMPVEIILQSYNQGVATWGRPGMQAMWDAVNHLMYLGGSRDPDVLEKISRLVDEEEVLVRTTSGSGTGLGPTSVSRSTRRERVLSVGKLAALPPGRAILLSHRTRPLLGETVPWTRGPYADAIRASVARYAPDPSAYQAELDRYEQDAAAGDAFLQHREADTWRTRNE